MSVTQFAADAAKRDDRYLFIVMTILFIVMMGWMIRYFIRSNEALQEQHRKLSDGHAQTLEKLFHNSNETAKQVAVVLDRNNALLEKIERDR